MVDFHLFHMAVISSANYGDGTMGVTSETLVTGLRAVVTNGGEPLPHRLVVFKRFESVTEVLLVSGEDDYGSGDCVSRVILPAISRRQIKPINVVADLFRRLTHPI